MWGMALLKYELSGGTKEGGACREGRKGGPSPETRFLGTFPLSAGGGRRVVLVYHALQDNR